MLDISMGTIRDKHVHRQPRLLIALVIPKKQNLPFRVASFPRHMPFTVEIPLLITAAPRSPVFLEMRLRPGALAKPPSTLTH